MPAKRTTRTSRASLFVLCGLLAAVVGCRHKKEVEPLPSLDDLAQQMQSKDKDERYTAVKQLSQFAPQNKEAVPPLIAALSDKDADVRWVATKGLEQFGSAAGEAVPKLILLLHDTSATVRAGAARALCAMGVAGLSARPALTLAMNDPDPEVRAEVNRAMKTLYQVQQYQSVNAKSSN